MHTFIILFVVLASFLLFWFLLIRKGVALEKSILFAIVIFGILTNIVFVPGLVLDEPAHIETAYRYANFWLGKPYTIPVEDGIALNWDHKGILVRSADQDITALEPFHGPSASAYQTVRDRFEWFCSEDGTKMIPKYDARAVECGFLGYLFSSFGMVLARLFRLGTYPMLYIGRLMNLAFYAFCIYWTMRIAPFKKWLFGLLSLTPMAMQLVCSFSYDSPLMGMSFLVIAWLLKLAYTPKQITRKEWLLTCFFSFLLIPCKFTFAPFLPMFLIPSVRCGGKGKKALLVLSVIFSGVLGFLIQYPDMIATYLGGVHQMASDSQNQRSQPLYTLGWILANPKETLQVFLHTIRQEFDFYWTNMLGGRLAVFDPVINWTLILLCTFLLASVHDPKDAIQFSPKQRLLFLSGFVFTLGTAMLLMMFMWTPLGSEVIEGVQGRYFLPALPLLFLALGTGSITLTEKAKRWLTTLVFTLNAAALIEVLMWIRTFP